jgi:arylsulfatase A-like enzyme
MSVDDLVEDLFSALEALGEQETIAIFTSDNGYLWGEHGIGRDKRFPYSGSVRVPLLLRWPGHVEPGGSDARLAASVDIAPTILTAAGIVVDPADIDGTSLLDPGVRTRVLQEYWRSPDAPYLPGWAALRRAGSLFVEWRDDDGTLLFREYYDLVHDPYERRNLLGDQDPRNDPDVDRLSRALARLSRCRGNTCRT